MPQASSNHVHTVSRSWHWIHFLALSALFLPPSLAAGQQAPVPSQPQLAPEVRSRLTEAAGDSKLAPWQREFMLGVAREHVDGGATGQPPALPGRALPPAGIASIDGEWTDFRPPSARYGHTAIYDPVRVRMVVFGGNNSAGSSLNDVWALSLSGSSPAWSKIAPAGSPPGRLNHTAIYDPVRDRMIVFGGQGGGSNRNDVWALSLSGGLAWSQLTPGGSPPPARSGHTAIYDPVRDRIVVFGGLDGTRYDDVWVLSLAAVPAWSELAPAGSPPSARVGHAAIYDPVRDRMVIYGGSDIGGARTDVWALSLAGSPAWSQLAPGGSYPPARSAHTACYDPGQERMLVFGGFSGSGYFNDVWALSLVGTGSWSVLASSGSPPTARIQHTTILDPSALRLVVFGGADPSGHHNDVKALPLFGSMAWSTLASSAPPAPSSAYVAFYDSHRDRMVMYGGNNDVSTLSLDGTPIWGAIQTFFSPPDSRSGFSAIYDPYRDRMLLFGGLHPDLGGVSTWYDDAWELSFNGNPWFPIGVAGVRPSPRYYHTAIYDPVRDRMVVFGGYNNDAGGNYLNDVWALSLAGTPTWTNLAPAGSPPAGRIGHTAIYDPNRDRMVVFGGYGNGVVLNDVWALSLAGSPAWTALAPGGTPPGARYVHSAIFDAGRDRMVIFGGNDGSSPRNEVWALSFAGSPAWSALAPGGGPPAARHLHVAIHDPVRDQMVVFGGVDAVSVMNDLWVLRYDATPPTVQVLAPNGGETLDNATPITIAWSASDNRNVARVLIYASADGGLTYSGLGYNHPNDGSYDWNGAPLTTRGRVRVIAFDNAGNASDDMSDGNFAVIDPTPPAVPAPVAGVFTGGPVQLHWAANTEGDFALYHLYRGSTAAFVPGPGNLVVSQPDTGFVDAGSTWSYYKLSALDVGGHESGFALVEPAGQVLGATPPGSPMPVPLGSNVQLTFQNVTSGGLSQLTLQTGGSAPPNGLRLSPSSPPLYYVLSTTATFTGSVTVCITYDPANVNGNESNLKLMHRDGGTWVPVTTSLNVADNVICGTVTHFSEFALMEADPTVAVDDAIPSAFLLLCAPNPISGSARVQYDLPVASPVALGLFDLQGRMVRQLERRTSAGPGRYTVQWDGRGVRGSRVPAGIYFLRLDAGSFHQVRRVVVTE